MINLTASSVYFHLFALPLLYNDNPISIILFHISKLPSLLILVTTQTDWFQSHFFKLKQDLSAHAHYITVSPPTYAISTKTTLSAPDLSPSPLWWPLSSWSSACYSVDFFSSNSSVYIWHSFSQAICPSSHPIINVKAIIIF